MTAVMPLRALVGVAALSTTLGLSVVAPTSASATAGTGSTVRATVLPTLRAGSANALVSNVQYILSIRRTGVYDSATVAAVKRLQLWKKVYPANGIVAGKATWLALRDPTLGYVMRTSHTARAAYPFTTWQTSVHGRGVAYRESKLSCTALSRGAAYRGKWQMSLTLWRANGGIAFAAAPEKASCVDQDKVAYRIWVRSGWRPWGG
jgi:hypothetical protein